MDCEISSDGYLVSKKIWSNGDLFEMGEKVLTTATYTLQFEYGALIEAEVQASIDRYLAANL